MKAPSFTTFSRISFLASLYPSYITTSQSGNQTLNSRAQFGSTALGAKMRCGPFTPLFSARYARSEIHWMVFPKPISSARIPLSWLLYSETIHCNPASWYDRMVPLPLGPTKIDGCTSISSTSALCASLVNCRMALYFSFFPFGASLSLSSASASGGASGSKTSGSSMARRAAALVASIFSARCFSKSSVVLRSSPIR